MTESLGTAALELEGDLSPLERDLAAAKRKAATGGTGAGGQFGKQFGTGIKRATLPALAALGLVAAGVKRTTDAASDLGESQNAVNVVYGQAAEKLSRFAQVADTEAGLSMRAFNELVTPVGAGLRNVGFGADEAADASINLAKRAADMASVFNTDVSEAMMAIQAGLRGEADPLERFGVGLSDAAVQAKALEMGMKKTDGQFTASQKTQARLALLFEQTDRVAGDFKNTSDELANSRRIDAAQTENQAAKMGKGLLPVMELYQTILRSVVGFLGAHTGAVKIGALALTGLAAAVLLARGALGLYSLAQGIALAFTSATNAALIAQRVLLAFTLVGALLLVATTLIVLWKKSETFRRIVTGVFSAVRAVVGAFASFFTQKLPAAFNRVLGWVRSNWPKIAVFLSGPFAPLVILATDAFGIRSRLIGALGKLLTGAKNKARDIGRGIKNAMTGALEGLSDAVVGYFRGAINGIIGLWNRLAIPGFTIPGPGPLPSISVPGVNIPDIPYLHAGGIVPGVPGEDVLAVLQAGERVVARAEVGGRSAAPAAVHFHFPRYTGNRRELVTDMKLALADYRRENGGADPW